MAAGSGSIGETGAGLQMDDTRAVTQEAEPGGGVTWPPLSEPLLSLTGDDFFFVVLVFALLLCCWRHLARRFLNHT